MIPMDCLYMFLSVHILQFGIKYMYVHLKSSFNVFWYKMYTRNYIVQNLHIITFGGEGIFIHFQKSHFVKKKGGVGMLDNYWQVSSGYYMFLLIRGQL